MEEKKESTIGVGILLALFGVILVIVRWDG